MVEVQSTWTVNIVWRLLLYQAETLNRYFQTTRQNTYTEKKLKVPVPEFYVLYTGERLERPRWISLADEFLNGDTSRLELRAEVLYGNGGSDILNQYVAFTKVYHAQVRAYGRTETAIQETIRICTDSNILTDYLKAHKQEVRSIMLTLFDQEYLTKLYGEEQRQEGREEGREEGRAEGREEGRVEGRTEGREEGEHRKAIAIAGSLLKAGMDRALVAEHTGLPLEEVDRLSA